MGAIFAPTRFSLVRISVRDLVEDGKSLLRNSGVGGGGENLILSFGHCLFYFLFGGGKGESGATGRRGGVGLLLKIPGGGERAGRMSAGNWGRKTPFAHVW